MASTRDETIREVTETYLQTINPKHPPSPDVIQGAILDDIAVKFQITNAVRSSGKWRLPDRLNPPQIAQVLAYLYPIVLIDTGTSNQESDYMLLGMYQTSGPNMGIYVTQDEVFRKLARQYCYSLSRREFEEMILVLRDIVPIRKPCREPNLVAVNNGIFDYDTKTMLPFTPDLVFLSKSKVDYNSNAKNVVIHNPDDNTDWDVESWMQELSDDKEVVELLWKILGAVIRPNVPWNKAAWFYSESGNNGKGTLCELMRQLVGEGSYASIPLSDFGKDFMLEPLTHVSAIIVDENDVGTYIDKAANLKAVVTGDAIQINRKFKTPIPYRFHGFMVQCLNEMPRIRDKSDSFYRRQLFIPFLKCFTGAERKYIKHDYLHRKDVLEYVLYRVLHMNYYDLDVPVSCQQALAEYKEYNDPLRQFAEEMIPQLQWDLVPFSFLYDLYTAWYKKNYPGRGEMKSSISFTKDWLLLLPDYPEWTSDKKVVYKPYNRMDKTEPLIAEYDLTNWMDPRYTASKDIDKRCHPVLKSSYRGMYRS